MEKATLVYDQDCGFCRWSLGKILAWDRGRRILPVAAQDPESDRLLPGMDHATKMESWHLVSEDGRTYSAGAAAPPLLRLLPGGRPLAAVAATFPRTVDRAYRWVAGHRDRLGRAVGEKACAIDPKVMRPHGEGTTPS